MITLNVLTNRHLKRCAPLREGYVRARDARRKTAQLRDGNCPWQDAIKPLCA